MPTFTELVAEIQSSDWEKGKEVAKQLADIYKEIETTKQQSIEDLKKQAKTIVALVAAEGDDFETKLADAAKKVASREETIKKLTKDLADSNAAMADLKQNELLSLAKEKSGVNTNVLKTLLSEEDKVEVNGDKVTVNGKDIKEWAKTEKIDFISALFPSKNSSDLPNGGSKGTKDLPKGGSEGDKQDKKTKPAVLQTANGLEMAQKNINYW